MVRYLQPTEKRNPLKSIVSVKIKSGKTMNTLCLIFF